MFKFSTFSINFLYMCVGLYVLAQNLYVEILTPNVMELGGGVFGRSLGHEGESRIGGISVLIKGTLQRFLAPFSTFRYKEKSVT